MIRWGIVGTGKIAHDFTLAISSLQDAQVIAVSSRKQSSVDEFGEKFQIPKRYADHEQLAKDPEVEIVYISSLHPYHKEHSCLFLSHGKSVLCEKPIGMNARELKEMIALAKKNNVFFMEAMWTRYFPLHEKIRNFIKDGTIGRVHMVQIDFGFKDPGVQRLTDASMGGGGLLDIGIYPLSLASMIFDGKRPSIIRAVGDIDEKTGVDHQVSISMRYDSDQLVSLFCTLRAETPREAVIIGEKGRIKLHKPFWCPTKMTLTILKDGKEEDHEFTTDLPKPKWNLDFNFVNSQGMAYEAKYVHQCLKEGKKQSDVLSLDESLIIMETMDEVRKQIGLVYPQDL